MSFSSNGRVTIASGQFLGKRVRWRDSIKTGFSRVPEKYRNGLQQELLFDHLNYARYLSFALLAVELPVDYVVFVMRAVSPDPSFIRLAGWHHFIVVTSILSFLLLLQCFPLSSPDRLRPFHTRLLAIAVAVLFAIMNFDLAISLTYWQFPPTTYFIGIFCTALLLTALGSLSTWAFVGNAIFYIAALQLWQTNVASLAPSLALGLFSTVLAWVLAHSIFVARAEAYVTRQLLAEEREISESLLRNILPNSIAARLKQGQRTIADSFSKVTILFADIVGFTPLSVSMNAEAVVLLLNEIFCRFDALADRHQLEKIKTIGDAYMVVGGLPEPREDAAAAVARMALDMQEVVRHVGQQHDRDLKLRTGMHTGSVVAGVIGHRKFSYDLWGDAVNTASRMESTGVKGRIQMTAATATALGERFVWVERGPVDVKGKGTMVTFFLQAERKGVAEE